MKQTTKKVLGLVEKVTRIKVENDSSRRIPLCMGFLHQPKRPDKKEQK